jgi:pimeloyl-ACP methyl ester carboxylesterase
MGVDMLELELEIKAADGVLSGTLCLPSDGGSFPCVLMLPGSGPLDRDENVEGQRLDIFNTIAHQLAQTGFASLRYDKRGCGKSTGGYYQAGYFDFVEDAIACFDSLKCHPHCMSDRIYALGHSEGTLTAMHLSLRRRDVAGMIQLCPTAEDCEPALLRQAGRVRDVMRDVPESGDPVASQRNLIERVRTQHAEPHELESHYIGLKWFREVLDLDVRELYAKMARPMLLIAGAKDVQCHPAEVPGLRELTSAPAEIHVVPNLTHVLRFDQEQPSILRYPELIQNPVEPLVLSLISRWLVQQEICSPAAAHP